jgi:hypothetical protein
MIHKLFNMQSFREQVENFLRARLEPFSAKLRASHSFGDVSFLSHSTLLEVEPEQPKKKLRQEGEKEEEVVKLDNTTPSATTPTVESTTDSSHRKLTEEEAVYAKKEKAYAKEMDTILAFLQQKNPSFQFVSGTPPPKTATISKLDRWIQKYEWRKERYNVLLNMALKLGYVSNAKHLS